MQEFIQIDMPFLAAMSINGLTTRYFSYVIFAISLLATVNIVTIYSYQAAIKCIGHDEIQRIHEFNYSACVNTPLILA